MNWLGSAIPTLTFVSQRTGDGSLCPMAIKMFHQSYSYRLLEGNAPVQHLFWKDIERDLLEYLLAGVDFDRSKTAWTTMTFSDSFAIAPPSSL